MSPSSPISLLPDVPSPDDQRITRLYEHLELFSEGEPPHNAFFVLGRAPLAAATGEPDQLLVVDPPDDLGARFQIDGRLALLHTLAPAAEPPRDDLPLLRTQPGGVAHVQIGQHFLDIYSQRDTNVVHLPALGVLLSGPFGSDALVPTVAAGSTGEEELETLRLLASLVKRRLALLVPRVGAVSEGVPDAMRRLADDVAYLHALRRTVSIAVERGDPLDAVIGMADALLPSERSGEASRAVHRQNVRHLAGAPTERSTGDQR